MPLEFKMYSYMGPEPLKLNVPLLPSPRKWTAQSSTSSAVTPPAGILAPPEFANSFQLDIISALRGHPHSCLSRAPVADAILGIDSDQQKLELIDFLASEEQGAIASTLENNACKAFHCSPPELTSVALQHADQEEFLCKLVDLFEITLHKIIPNTFAMLYPLQFDCSFQIRTVVLQHFRDRVLLHLLSNLHFDQETLWDNPDLERALRQMFWLISIELEPNTDESDRFEEIYSDFLGLEMDVDHHSDNVGLSDFRVSSQPIDNVLSASCPSARELHSVPTSLNASSANLLSAPDKDTRRKQHYKARKGSPNPKMFAEKETKREEGEEGAEAERKRDGIVRKDRARTLPSKSVSFWDDESTVEV